MPKEVRNFRAYIFTDTEIEKMLDSADHFPVCMQNPVKKYQIPVMFRMLFNCGLRTSELLNLRVCDVDFTEKVLAIRDTKFHKSRLVPFTDAVAIPLANYLELFPPASNEAILFASCCSRSKGEQYGASWIHTQFRILLRMSEIPYGGPDRGPRPHDMRHTFAVHCLNNWVLVGEDLTAGLPVLSTYLGHNDLCQIALGIIPIHLVNASGVGVSLPNNRLVRQPADALAACINVRHRQIAPRLNAVYTVFYRSLKLGQR